MAKKSFKVFIGNISDTPPPRPDSRNDDAGSSSSGSTTLSATSSPGMAVGMKYFREIKKWFKIIKKVFTYIFKNFVGDRANMSGGEESNNVLQPNLR